MKMEEDGNDCERKKKKKEKGGYSYSLPLGIYALFFNFNLLHALVIRRHVE
jgi:hypothetical protein